VTDIFFSSHPALRVVARKNVLAGLMFMAVAAFGLWLSWNYPVGTALRMGTGYVPRLLCWVLMALGAVVLVQGLRERDSGPPPRAGGGLAAGSATNDRNPLTGLFPIIVVTGSLVAFGLSVERLGLVVAILLLIGIGGLAARGIKPWEVLATALGLIVLAWVIFIQGLGLTIPVWPDW
jgi:putative tricarboxylic transport membrane protein